MSIACVVLHYGDPKTTQECLNSLQKLSIPKNISFKIIIVDNDPKNRFSLKDKTQKNIHLIRNEQNMGYSEGNNIGIRQALAENADYIMVLNNDTRLDKSCLVHLLSCLTKEGTGIAVPKIYFEKGFEFHKGRYKKDEVGKVIWYSGGIMDWGNLIGSHRGVDEVDKGQYDKSESTEIATGCCILVKREVFKEVGLYDKNYFLYYEDADFSMRVKQAGYTIIYCPKAVVWHKNAEASGSGSLLQDYFITRNRLLFGTKYAPLRTKVALLREAFNLSRSGREWQKKGVTDFYLRRFGRGSFNI